MHVVTDLYTKMIALIAVFLTVVNHCYAMDDVTQELMTLPELPERPWVQLEKPSPCQDMLAYCQHAYNLSTPGKQEFEGGMAEVIAPKDMDGNFVKHRCFCDPDCHLFGDCCPDAVTAMDPTHTLQEFEDNLLASRTERQREWECHSFFKRPQLYMYMIGSCPASYKNTITVNRCRRQVPQLEYDYMLDIPVLSMATNLTYINVYCAICNNDKMLHKWDIQIDCPSELPNCTQELHARYYVPGEKRWQLQSPEIPTKILVTFAIKNTVVNSKEYYREFGARKCQRNVIGTCPLSWMGSKEKVLCLSYALIVQSRETSNIYKNEYCAICNGEMANHLQCPPVYLERFDPDWLQDPMMTSYAVLLDFMGQGSQVGEAGGCGLEGLDCGFGELCDQLHMGCRVYTCGRMYQMAEDGRCVQMSNASDVQMWNFTELPYLNSTCPKFYVTKDDFIRYINSSVYIKTIDKMYNDDQYEVVNSTTILICTNHDSNASWKFSAAQSTLSNVCTTLSLICLAAHVVIHILTPALHNLPGNNMLSLSIALLSAQLFFQFGINMTSPSELCTGISLIIHFGFLASFLWMNVMALDVFGTFASITKFRSPGNVAASWKFRVYSLYAWSMAFIVVLSAFINDVTHWMPGYEPQYGDPLCWINNRKGLLTFFVVPLALLLTANIAFFTLSVKAICQTRKLTKLVRKNSSNDLTDKTTIILYVKLALIMGLTWIFGFVAALADLEIIWYFFILLNCLQGAFIFIAFSCKRSIILKLPCCFRHSINVKNGHEFLTKQVILTTTKGKCTSV